VAVAPGAIASGVIALGGGAEFAVSPAGAVPSFPDTACDPDAALGVAAVPAAAGGSMAATDGARLDSSGLDSSGLASSGLRGGGAGMLRHTVITASAASAKPARSHDLRIALN